MLEQASSHVEALAGAASSAMQTMRLDAVPGALPGSLSAGRASSLDSEWQTAAEDMRTMLGAHGEALGQTADAYEQRETAAERSISSFFGGLL